MAGDGHFAAQNALLGTPKEPTLPSPPPWRAIRCSFSLLKKICSKNNAHAHAWAVYAPNVPQSRIMRT